MSVTFDVTAANAYLSFTVGGAGAVGSGAYTMAVLVQPAVGNNNAAFVAAYTSGTANRVLFEDTLHLFGNNDFSSGFGTLTQGTWYLLAQTKAAGSNTFRHHIWAYASNGSGTMTHGVAAGASGQGDGSAATELRIGGNLIKGNGPNAVAGFWTRALSDAELDSMKSGFLTAWRDVSGGAPNELIHFKDFDGTNGSTATIAIGTSAFSSKTGTTTAGANPPSFDFSLGGTGATATPAVVAAVAAVPAPVVSPLNASVTAAVVAAVAAVPAATLRMSVAITPATVAAVAAVGTATLAAGQTVAAVKVSAVAAVGAPVITSNAAVTPGTVAAVGAVPSVSLSTGSVVAAVKVSAVAAVGTVTVTAVTNAAVTAATVAAVAAVGTPSVSAGGSATVVAVTVATVATVGTSAVSAGSIVTTSTVAAVAAVGTPVVRLGALITPATVAVLAAVGAAAVTTAGNAVIAVATVIARAGVGTVIVVADAGGGAPRPTLVHVAVIPLVHVRDASPLEHVAVVPLAHTSRGA